MTKSRYILKNITSLNALLIVIIVFATQHTVLPLLNIHVNYSLPSQKKTKEEKKVVHDGLSIPSPSDYVIVSEENLFHPERKIPPEKKEESPLPMPEVLLYGTLITDDTAVAYIEDLKSPRSTPGRGKRQTAMKKGDVLSGFILKDIEPDKIVMVRGEEQMVVPVMDPQKRKTREAAVTASRTPAGQPSQAASPPPAKPKTPQAAQPVVKKEPPPRSRPMTPADDRIMRFFDKQRVQ